MTADIRQLQEEIKHLKQKEVVSKSPLKTGGYGIAIALLTDLISCILVGLGLGLFFQKFFHTPVLLTAGFTLLGGVAGLYSVIRFALNQDKK